MPEEDWEYGGDNNDIIQLPFVAEKCIDGSHGVMHDQSMDMLGNKTSNLKKAGLRSLVDFVICTQRSSTLLVEVS